MKNTGGQCKQMEGVYFATKDTKARVFPDAKPGRARTATEHRKCLQSPVSARTPRIEQLSLLWELQQQDRSNYCSQLVRVGGKPTQPTQSIINTLLSAIRRSADASGKTRKGFLFFFGVVNIRISHSHSLK